MLSPDRVVTDPTWQPFVYDANTDRMDFVNLPREVQREVAFIDQRYVNGRPKVGPFATSTLPRDMVRAHAGQMHYIFHTAFCCSTLLTRAFDLPGASMGLKEPAIIGSFPANYASNPRSFDENGPLSIAVDLLSRPLSPGETQVLKISNMSNTLVHQLLKLRPGAKVVIMHSSLEDYLNSIIRRGIVGRVFNRNALLVFLPFMALEPLSAPERLLRLTDLEVSALVWLMQMRLLHGLIAQYGAARVKTLQDAKLLADPTRALTCAGNHFGIGPRGTTWGEIAGGPIFGQHSKAHGRSYGAEQRSEERRVSGDEALEIDTITKWARSVAVQTATPLHLGDTLTTSAAQ
jgi:hypothetical protein